MRHSITFLLALVAVVLGACERPFVDPPAPIIEIVEPDPSTIVPSDSVLFALHVEAMGQVDSVVIEGRPLTFDEDDGLWLRHIPLRRGFNALDISIFSGQERLARDTTYAYRGTLAIDRSGPDLMTPRGGHTATLIGDGTNILILGGATRYGGPARRDVARNVENVFLDTPIEMAEPRAGHTATLLPDGRVLILGGSRNSVVTNITDLVELVELYDPQTSSFNAVPFEGEPIRRAYHTAVFREDGERWLIDLYGGEGDVRYGSNPILGTRNDLRTFQFRSDSLLALSPAPGPNLGFSFSGHTLTPLDDRTHGDPGRMLLAGAYYGPQTSYDIESVIDYDDPEGLIPTETGQMHVHRTMHAAAAIAPGQVVVFGGHQGRPANAVSDVEIFVEEAGRFFRYPQSGAAFRRFGLSATKFANQRILFLGGFASSGDAVTFSEIYIPNTP